MSFIHSAFPDIQFSSILVIAVSSFVGHQQFSKHAFTVVSDTLFQTSIVPSTYVSTKPIHTSNCYKTQVG